jgi:hypothetical protein
MRVLVFLAPSVEVEELLPPSAEVLRVRGYHSVSWSLVAALERDVPEADRIAAWVPLRSRRRLRRVFLAHLPMLERALQRVLARLPVEEDSREVLFLAELTRDLRLAITEAKGHV